MSAAEPKTRCGLVTLLGRTNVGKSTLLNELVGAKVAITTDRTQTTRRALHGVLTEGEAQAVFVDTPGIHRPEDRSGQRLLRETREALEEVDLVLVVVEPGDRPEGGTRWLLDYLEQAGQPPALLVINKCDAVAPGDPAVRRTVEDLSAAYPFLKAYPVSARTGEGLEALTREVLARLPEGPFLYPPDEVSNVPQPFYAAELVREQAMRLTEDELPHALEVEVSELRREEDGTYVVRAVITVDRDSRKAILIGAGGQKIRAIREGARRELEEQVEAPVDLEVRVEVQRPTPAGRRPGGGRGRGRGRGRGGRRPPRGGRRG